MLKASGCRNSTCTDMLQILTNTLLVGLHLKLLQAQEMVRICAKHGEEPTSILDYEIHVHTNQEENIISALNEPVQRSEWQAGGWSIEKEFQYTKDVMRLIKRNGKTDTEEFKNSKEVREVNVREKLNEMGNFDIVVFTEGSALSNPHPTGAGAVIYVDGYDANPILLKKRCKSSKQ